MHTFSLLEYVFALSSEGHQFELEAIAVLSPYLTWHINRFGLYQLDAERQPLPINFELAFEGGDSVLADVS